MDPNEALRRLRELCDLADKGEADVSEELANQFRELDNWLHVGGFLPRDWDNGIRMVKSHRAK